MRSLAIVCCSRTRDGTFIDGQMLADLVREQAPVRWYQCVDPHASQDFYRGDRVVTGRRIPIATLEEGVNRLWVFPHRLRGIEESAVLALDPTLVNIPLKGKVGIIKVNDLRPLTPYSDKTSTRIMFSYALRRLSRFDWIVTLSDHTKALLVERGFDGAKIEVIPGASRFHPEIGAPSPSPRVRTAGSAPFAVTYVATDRPYKNLDFFLRLAQEIGRRPEGSTVRFQLVSRLTPATRRRLDTLKIRNLQVLEDVEDLSSVYRKTDLLAHPSLYEGYGLPLAEAMSFGIPVLTNRLRPMSDVVGNAGILLEPNDLPGWTEATLALAAGKDYSELSRRALERSKEFSPERVKQKVRAAFTKFLA